LADAAPWPLHPQIQALLDSDPGDAEPSELEARRGAYAAIVERLGGIPPAVAAVADEAVGADAVPVRVYRPVPEADGPAGVVVYAHGGGWCMGDLDGFDRIARALCSASGHHVVSVGYRLAPEHPFPAARDDVLAAVDWSAGDGAAAYGWHGDRLALCGDSAGAQLVAVAARHRRALVRAQLLAYPALDATMSGGSYRRFSEGTMLSADVMAACWADYAAGADPRDPDLSPGLADDLEGLPAALIVLASHDVLRDDGRAYAERLQAAGVDVTLCEVAGHVHGFLRWAGAVDAAGDTLAAMGTYARAALAGPEKGEQGFRYA
jgi:acetyl esterase